MATTVTAEEALRIAIERHRQGQLDSAAHIFGQVLAQYPNSLTALEGLGAILLARGRHAEALALHERALRLDPANDRVLNNYGLALRGLRRDDEAAAVFRRALAVAPDAPLTLMNLAMLLDERGHTAEALSLLERATSHAGANAGPYGALSNILGRLGRTAEAERALKAAIALEPRNARLAFNLGNLYLNSGRLPEAETAYLGAIAIDPGYFDPYHNLGHVYTEQGRIEEAAACFRKGTELQPQNFNPHMSYGMMLLALGRYSQGWAEYQWRLHDQVQIPSRGFSQPRWAGESLKGKTLLLSSEQGAGDAVMFIRYLPMLAERADRIVVECLAPLRRLFEHTPHCAQVVVKGEALPDFDCYIAPIDLPFIFGTTLETIPASVPYLPAPDPSQIPDIALPDTGRKRVGLVWAGNPLQRHNPYRSIPPRLLGPLLDVPGVDFYCLQYGADKDALQKEGVADRMILPGDDRIVDFWQLGGLMKQMDLMISVCTGPCHLAGALGVRTWTLLRFAAEWRWMTGREDTPWYPTMRLFRQRSPGDWQELVERVATALRTEL